MAAKPLHIEHAGREDLLQVPGIGVERVKVILARRKALGGTMTEFEFLELGFPSSCTQKILDEHYIRFSEQVVGLDKSSLLSVQSSANFGYQTDTVNTVSHEKTEFDICDAKSTLLQSDVFFFFIYFYFSTYINLHNVQTQKTKVVYRREK